MITVTAIIIVGLSFFFNQWLAFIAAILLFVMLIISVFIFRRFYRYLDRYLDDLSGKISVGSDRAVKTMPLGLIVLNENDQIEWVNPFISERIERNVISDPINEVYPNILKQLEKAKEIEIADGAYAYRVRYSEKNIFCIL